MHDRSRLAVDRHARDGIRRREGFGDDVARLGQRRRCIARGFARQGDHRGVRVDRDRAHHRRRRDVACGIGCRDRYAGQAGIAGLHRVSRRVIVAHAVVHCRRNAIDRDAADGVGRREGFGDDVARLGQRVRRVVRGFGDLGDRWSQRVNRIGDWVRCAEGIAASRLHRRDRVRALRIG